MEDVPVAQPLLAGDEIDPELLALPAPERRGKAATIVALLVALLASAAMATALQRDVRFSVIGTLPVDLGDLRSANLSQVGAEGGSVVGGGMVAAAGAIRFERPFVSASFRLVPVAGRDDLWVELRVPSGMESGRYVPPKEFSGRLVKMSAAGLRHRGLAAAVERVTGKGVPKGAWLLVDGEAPAGVRYAVGLFVLFSGFALFCAYSIFRILRPVRD